jgi:hypothetical protein
MEDKGDWEGRGGAVRATIDPLLGGKIGKEPGFPPGEAGITIMELPPELLREAIATWGGAGGTTGFGGKTLKGGTAKLTVGLRGGEAIA